MIQNNQWPFFNFHCIFILRWIPFSHFLLSIHNTGSFTIFVGNGTSQSYYCANLSLASFCNTGANLNVAGCKALIGSRKTLLCILWRTFITKKTIQDIYKMDQIGIFGHWRKWYHIKYGTRTIRIDAWFSNWESPSLRCQLKVIRSFVEHFLSILLAYSVY